MSHAPLPLPIAPHVVAVVGGGFSGTLVAVHLARSAGDAGRPLRVLLFERGPRLARGVAYSTACERHLLNVPAALMSALPDEPGHFLGWLRALDPAADAGTFAPRRAYGDYLEDLLRDAARREGVALVPVRDEVVELVAQADGSAVALITRGGRTFRADRAVLALGNPAPRAVAEGVDRFAASGRYAPDPWKADALEGLARDAALVLVGSGLTAVDLIVEARSRGHAGPITVLSRHGLLPQRHRPAAPVRALAPPPPPPVGPGGRVSMRALLRHLRREAERYQGEVDDWRPAVDSMRPHLARLWRGCGQDERLRFLRHLAARWDVHRHRVAPEIDRALDEARRSGQLAVVAGRVVAVEDRGVGLEVRFVRRGRPAGPPAGAEAVFAHRLVNCSGPSREVRAGASPLVDALIARGLARPDPLALGLEATDDGALVDADGSPSDRLFALGPILKGQLWETTAVRELRAQARDLARHLIATVRPPESASPDADLLPLHAPAARRLGMTA